MLLWVFTLHCGLRETEIVPFQSSTQPPRDPPVGERLGMTVLAPGHQERLEQQQERESLYLGRLSKAQAPALLSGDSVLPEQFQTSRANEENTCKTGLSSGFKVKGTKGFLFRK